MAFKCLQSFIEKLESEGELTRISERVSTDREITEITDRVSKRDGQGPALLFEKVVNHNNGNRLSEIPVLINTFGTKKRMNLALGVSDIEEVAGEIRSLVKTEPPSSFMDKLRMLPKLAKIASYTPKKVSSGVCQEVVHQGDQVDLNQFPILKCWPDDGGSFITFGCVISRAPQTGIRNVGLYRQQIIDKNTIAMHWQIHKHGSRHFQEYRALGKKIPVAVYLGGDPALMFAGACPLPDNFDELIFAGFLRKKAVEMVPCKTIDLEVPANAEMILEGYVDPSEPLIPEGPFGDHTGYYTPVDLYPAFHVTAITHRRNMIYPTTIVGIPPMEDGAMGKAIERIFLPLIQLTFPEIKDMNLPVETCFHNLAIISIKKSYPAHAKKIMSSLWGMGQLMFSKAIIVVDEDVNVQDLKEVAWRVSNNIDAKRDIIFTEGPVDALDHAAPVFAVGSKMGIDATKKWKEEGYTREWPEVIKMDAATREKVDSIWNKLGIK
ncbi:MAG: menaquinone biosynthesis decarboxylase [Deltaproteobacteria bacterium]|nr:menaquinone biosynthesis decarboxylase [Deltaproteobacteria bacterium]